MISEAPAMTVRQRLGELLNEVQYRRQRVVITKAGKPVAALVDIGVFDRLRKLDEEFEHLRGRLAEAFSDYSEAEVDALVREAVEAVRAKSGIGWRSSLIQNLQASSRTSPYWTD